MKAARKIPRMYKKVDVRRAAEVSGFLVTLDGKAIQTPAKVPLALPTEALAWGIATEWDAQTKHFEPHTMPLMKLATTTIDQVPTIRGTMTDSMLRCMQSDAACLRSDMPDIAAKEAARFDPLLAWLRDDVGLQLATTSSLHLSHPDEALPTARSLLGAADDWELSALDAVSGSCKSLVLALAVCRGRIGAAEACLAARVGEDHQIEEWGMVEAGHDLDEADLRVRVSAASAFLQLLRLTSE